MADSKISLFRTEDQRFVREFTLVPQDIAWAGNEGLGPLIKELNLDTGKRRDINVVLLSDSMARSESIWSPNAPGAQKLIGQACYFSSAGGNVLQCATLFYQTPATIEIINNLDAYERVLELYWGGQGPSNIELRGVGSVVFRKAAPKISDTRAVELSVEYATKQSRSSLAGVLPRVPEDDDTLLCHNITTLSALLGLHRQTVSAMIEDGRLPHEGRGPAQGLYQFKPSTLRAIREQSISRFAAKLDRFALDNEDRKRMVGLAMQKLQSL